MTLRIHSARAGTFVLLAACVVGCGDSGGDDDDTAGTQGMAGSGGNNTTSSGGIPGGGAPSSSGGAASGQAGQGAGGAAGSISGSSGTTSAAGAGAAGAPTGGTAGTGTAGSGAGRGGVAGQNALAGAGGIGGTPGLDSCPMPPDGTPESALTALDTENTLRLAMGLDCAVIASPLVQSAQAHCDYYTQNEGDDVCEAPSPHDEIADCPGFTGEGLGERFKAAGYKITGSGSECMAFVGDPERSVMTFVNSVYHRTPILDPWMRDFGYGNTEDCDTIDFGTGTKTDKTKTAVYPYPGQTGVPTSFDGSREGPEPPKPSSGWPSGLPITIYAQNFTAESHVIKVEGSDEPLAHQWLDESDPTLPSYAKFLYTDAPMLANTTYHVSVEGTIDGTPRVFDWVFTTGAATGGGRPRP